jgi:hypothetical protein
MNNMLKEISDYVSPVKAGKQGIAEKTQTLKVSDTEVRDLDSAYRITKSVRIPNEKSLSYGRNGETLAEEIERRANGNEHDRLSGFVLSKMTTTGKDMGQMIEDGFAPMDMNPEDFVTVADKIKVQLAKAGADISKMGGISENAIQNIAGSDAEVSSIEEHLKAENLPSDNSIVKKVQEAYQKCEDLGRNIDTTISEGAVKVLINNEAEPTIGEVYTAVFGNGNLDKTPINEAIDNTEQNEELEEAFSKVIGSEDLETSPRTLKIANWLYASDLPVTARNIASVSEYEGLKVPDDKKKVEIVDEALREGREPNQAYLVSGHSMYDKAAKLAETMIGMTKEAGVVLQKLGINIDTTPIQELADKLHSLSLMGLETEEDFDIYEEVNSRIEELKEAPVETLGRLYQAENPFFLNQITLSDFTNQASSLKVEFESKGQVFEKMLMTYDGVGTEVRRDLGDSIQKAFRNVDDILEDLKLDVSVQNERAVRILAYNQIDINIENINTMKLADQTVQKVFNSLKPGVVLQMIKDQKNPLDMTMEELNTQADNSKNEMSGQSEEDNYAKFLWKMEHTKGITEEEKESFLGIFRLIHQVNKTDGAVIGQLVNQQIPVTMRNLMMAVRTRKNTGNEFAVDEEFGYVEAVNRAELSITQQVEVAFQSAHLKNAERIIEPAKLHEIEASQSIQEMTPEELNLSLQKYETDKELEKEWFDNLKEELFDASKAEAKVNNIIARLDIEETPTNINAVKNMLYNNRKVFSQLATKHVNDDGSVVDVEDPDIRAMMQQVTERFGEDSKNPEDMAKAMDRLADIAEHAMDKVLEESRLSYIDIKSLQAATKQMGLYSSLAKKDIYHLPITVATESGVLTLKIVKGERQRGLVDIFLETGSNSNTRATFRVRNEGVVGEITSDNKETKELMQRNREVIEAALRKSTKMDVHLKFRSGDLDKSNYFEEETKFVDDVEIETSRLYEMAKDFVGSLKMFG